MKTVRCAIYNGIICSVAPVRYSFTPALASPESVGRAQPTQHRSGWMARASICRAPLGNALVARCRAAHRNGAVLRALAASTAVSPAVCYQDSGGLVESERPKWLEAKESGSFGKPTSDAASWALCS